MRDINERLRDIQEAIVNIMKYASRGRDVFDQDELIQTWVIQHLVIIGNMSRALPQDFKNQHPEIEWKKLGDMRDALIYGYFEINIDRVWDVVMDDLPRLNITIDRILNARGSMKNKDLFPLLGRTGR